MSITDAIKDMEKHVGIENFEDHMNAPLSHNNQAYEPSDHTTGRLYVR